MNTRNLHATVVLMMLGLVAFIAPPQLTAQTSFEKTHLAVPATACAQCILPGASLEDVLVYEDGAGNAAAYSTLFAGEQAAQVHMLVSADPTNTPVISWRVGEDPELRNRELLTPKAQLHLPGAWHTTIVYLAFGEIWHEFTDGTQRLYLNARPGTPVLDAEGFAARKREVDAMRTQQRGRLQSPDKIARLWDAFYDGTLLDPAAQHMINDYAGMPNYAWHGGCTPTSAADILGYYDAVFGYGNLIKYHYGEYDAVQLQHDPSVPDVLPILIDEFGTDANGTTHANHTTCLGKEMHDAVLRQDPDQNWTDYGHANGASNMWDKTREQIDDEYPVIFSCSVTGGGHSMPCFGYLDSEFIACYDTWNPGWSWWDINHLILHRADWIRPDLSKTGEGIELTSLTGACVIDSKIIVTIMTQENNKITWDANPNLGKASIYINTSDGNGGEASWDKLVDLNENPGEWTWYTPEHYATMSARIRVRLWNSARSKVLSEDGSCTTVTIFNKSLPMLTSGASVDESWPTSAAASITSNKWAVAAVKSHNISTPNMLAMYADTTFGNAPVQDTVGGATGRSWGVCAVNVDGGPPGPLGLQVTNDGSGVLQYLESEELGWGESETDGWWQKNYDIVKAYGINISSQEAAAPGVKFIRLENQTDGDFVIRLFDTHKRFSAFYDAIASVDDSAAGKGEYLSLGISPTPGRYLVLLYQKGTILYEGPFRISLVNMGKLAQKIPFEAGRPDTVVHSKRRGTFSFGSGSWMLAGSVPMEQSRWKLEGALSRDFLRSPVTSNMGEPLPNFIVAKRPTAPGDSVHIRCTRLGPTGSTRLDICGLSQEPPLREGLNAPRPWPTGQRFHIAPIRTALPLKFFGISAKDERGGPIAVGIVPDGNVILHTPAMLWGKDSLDLPDAPNSMD